MPKHKDDKRPKRNPSMNVRAAKNVKRAAKMAIELPGTAFLPTAKARRAKSAASYRRQRDAAASSRRRGGYKRY